MITKIDDHLLQALEALPSQHRDQANLEAFVTIIAEAAQQLEDGIYPLLLGRMIDTAIGVQLDMIGRIVRQPRNGLSDEQYRLRLKVRIATNRSRGTLNELLNIVALALLPDVALVVATPQYPAAIFFDIRDLPVSAELASTIISFLRDGASAGVQIQMVTSGSEDDEVLYTSRSAYLSALTPSGVSTLAVDSTVGFPTNGTIQIDTGLASQESVAYFSKTSTMFSLSSVTLFDHEMNTDISLVGSRGKGLSDTDDLSKGGYISSIEEA